MQLITLLGAAALYTNTAFAHPQLEDRANNGHRLKWGHRRKNSGHNHFHAESDPEAFTSNTTQNSAAAALSTGRPTLSSTILSSYSNYSYSSNYTFTRPTSLTSSLSNTTYLALSTSLIHPKNPNTYITITASLTSTSYVSYSNTPSLYFPNTTRAAPSTSFSTAFSPSAQPSLQSSFRSINTTTSSSSSSVRWTNITMTSSPSLPNFAPSSFSSSTINRISIIATADPVLIASGSDLHLSTSVIPTTIITASGPSGTVGMVNPAALSSGIHGFPVGDYFLAEFIENKAGAPVTLLGCYRFCIGVYGIDRDVNLGPSTQRKVQVHARCDLYGGSVAVSLWRINNYVPNVWHDVGCGRPVV